MSDLFENNIGILTMAWGHKKYIRQAENLAISLKINSPQYKIALVTDNISIKSHFFDFLIPLDKSFGEGVIQKLYFDKYSPFQETLFIDSDCIVCRSIDEEVSKIRKYNFSPVCERYLGLDGYDSYINDIKIPINALKVSTIPKFNGGVYFFKKNSSAALIFENARELLKRKHELGIKNFDRHGPGEETLYALSLASLGKGALYNDFGKFMRPTMQFSEKININPINGSCFFNCFGKKVEPAICHFMGINSTRPSYYKCEWILRRKVGELKNIAGIFNSLKSYFINISLFYLKKWRFQIKQIFKE
jgi:hypothetical protein